MQNWRLIDTQKGSAAWNMAVDEALFRTFKEGDDPILRLYGWNPALSFGRFSNVTEHIDLKKLGNTETVRRITGGGILVHGGDLSYALILPKRMMSDRGVKETYRHLCGFLIRLYEGFGLPVKFAQTNTPSALCLAGTETYDLTINGKKIGGNAQRYSRGVLLQHGSIPMHIDIERFTPLFLEDSGLERAATLRSVGVDLTYPELAEAVEAAFCEVFGIRVWRDDMNEIEMETTQKLYTEKCCTGMWNYDNSSSSMAS